MDIHLWSPYIRRAADGYAEPGWRVPERVIPDYELLYVMEGELNVRIESNVYSGMPGDLFLLRPGQRHRISAVGPGAIRQPHIHFDLCYRHDSPDVKILHKLPEHMAPAELGWIRPDLLAGSNAELPDKLTLRQPRVFEGLLFRLIQAFNSKLPHAGAVAGGVFLELWVHLLRQHEWSAKPVISVYFSQLQAAKAHLDANYNQEVSLDDLAELASISKYYLISLFKQAFGMTPIKYQQFVRVEKAKEWISFTNKPLKEIAILCGYDNIHSFSRAFRQVDGLPPSSYRSRGQ